MTQPEFTAVVLAATCGSRLYPLTVSGDDGEDSDDNNGTNFHEERNEFNDYFDRVNDEQEDGGAVAAETAAAAATATATSDYLPKHLLPLAGRPLIHHLLEKLHLSNVNHVIIAISSIDKVTIPSLMDITGVKKTTNCKIKNSNMKEDVVQCLEFSFVGDEKKSKATTTTTSTATGATAASVSLKTVVKVVTLPSECGGSADALRFITSLQEVEEGRTTSTTTKSQSTTTTSTHNNDKMNDDDDNEENKQSQTSTDNGLIPNGSHVMVMSADLVLYGNLSSSSSTAAVKDNNSKNIKGDNKSMYNDVDEVDILGSLADVHRSNYYLGLIGESPPLAMTVVLTDVGECDSNGIPLKESAKAKKGGLSREDEDIEYIALSEINTTSGIHTYNQTSVAQRIILKQAKFNVEEDEDNTGQTPKLKLPKARLHAPIHEISIGKDWNDVHLYCLSPWVMKIITTKVHLKDLAKEVLPLLVECQFKGIKACLGISATSSSSGQDFGGDDDDDDNDDVGKKDADVDDEKVQVLTQLLAGAPFAKNHNVVPLGDSLVGDDDVNNSNKVNEMKDYPFTVLANTLPHLSSKLTLRACDVSSYSYACREVVSHAVNSNTEAATNLSLPVDAKFDTKFSSVIMQNCTFGEKVQIKSSTIGKNVTVGNRCRLNNVVVMDDVEIGENCILQNSVISRGCTIEDNCNLNDCQLGPKYLLPHGTKGKGESYVEDDIQ